MAMQLTKFAFSGLLLVSYSFVAASAVPENDRVECYPQSKLTAQECVRKGCIFSQSEQPGVPSCYVTPDQHGYRYAGSDAGSTETWSVMNQNKLTIPVTTESPYSVTGEPTVRSLEVEFERYSTRVMGFRIRDSEHKRYEVPSSVIKLAIPRRLNKHFYRVEYVSDPTVPFAFKIIRASTNTTLIDTTLGGMVFEENFVQFVTKLASSHVYGMGDHRDGAFRSPMDWATTTMFSRHTDPPVVDQKYHTAAHPFYMVVENDGNAHGIFVLNSNAMEYKFQPSPALTLRTLGGVLEFVVCFGVTPNDVIIEYTQTIGRPEILPYWALGFHESARVEDAEEVVKQFNRSGLPLDVVHVSSRESDREWDVTVMKDNLVRTVSKVQAAGGRAMVSLKPHIRVDAEDEVLRSAYQDGLWKDIFVKWPSAYCPNNSEILPETCGPSGTLFGYDLAQLQVAYIDYFQPAAVTWWEKWLTSLHEQIPWDGFDLIQNQPYSPQTNSPTSASQAVLQCPKNSILERTLYGRSNSSETFLSDDTICMVAEHRIHNVTFRHYDVHNIYGHSQAVATKKAVANMTGKRGFVMSESNYAGTGTVAGVWLKSSLKESVAKAIQQSINSAFEFNWFGITAAGGIAENVPEDPESCARWQIFALFHVLAKSVVSQCGLTSDESTADPALLIAVKKALDTRFRLLPYLYTLFFHGWMEGEAVFRPLFFEYGTKLHNKNVMDVADQFFWGSGIMFVPTFDKNATRDVYFPEDTFYVLGSGERISGAAKRVARQMPVNEMGVFLRAGYMIPTQPPGGATSVSAARVKDFTMLIASHRHSDGSAAANGNFFWDDGESIDTVEKKDYMSWFIYNRWQEGNFTRALLDYDIERNLAEDVMRDLKFSAFVVYGYDNCKSVDEIELRLDGRRLGLAKDAYSVLFVERHQLLTVNLTVPLSRNFKLEIICPIPV